MGKYFKTSLKWSRKDIIFKFRVYREQNVRNTNCWFAENLNEDKFTIKAPTKTKVIEGILNHYAVWIDKFKDILVSSNIRLSIDFDLIQFHLRKNLEKGI